MAALKETQFHRNEPEIHHARAILERDRQGNGALKPLSSFRIREALNQLSDTRPDHVMRDRLLTKHYSSDAFIDSEIQRQASQVNNLKGVKTVLQLLPEADRENLRTRIRDAIPQLIEAQDQRDREKSAAEGTEGFLWARKDPKSGMVLDPHEHPVQRNAAGKVTDKNAVKVPLPRALEKNEVQAVAAGQIAENVGRMSALLPDLPISTIRPEIQPGNLMDEFTALNQVMSGWTQMSAFEIDAAYGAINKPTETGIVETSYDNYLGAVGGPRLAWQAAVEALDDAGLKASEIEAVYAGTVFGDPGTVTRSLQQIGIVEVPVITIENACASGTSAFHESRMAVETGRYERVLAFGIETMTAHFDGAISPIASDPEGAQGYAMPSIYGMSAARYQHEYGVTQEQMAAVAVKNRRHALGNPRAQHRKAVTVEQVLDSPMVADPITLFQCCSIADAAAAAIVGPLGGSQDPAQEVAVRSSALRSGRRWDHTADKVWGWDIVADTAAQACEAAGVGIGDIDVFEVHDAFTIGEIITTEALGLCGLGEGGRLVESGRTALGGAQPVNPSGGLLSRGHPLGATGLAQIAEVVWQLRGMAADRQAPGARLGAVETMGGGTAGIDGNACVVAVLEQAG